MKNERDVESKKPCFIILFAFILSLLITGIHPVFAFEMKSDNYHLQLEPSDIRAIPQTSLGELEKNINPDEITTGFLSRTNNRLAKFFLLGFFLVFAIVIFFVGRAKGKFGIRRKKL